MINLRKIRKENNLSMKELGAEVGVAESTISLYETGKRQPDNETLLKLADYFGVSVDYLLGRDIDIDEEIRKDKERTGYVAGHGVAGNPLPFDIGEEIRKNKKYSGYLIGFGGEGQSMKKLTEDELKTINALLDALRENHSKNKPNK